ncbi:MAG: carboxypeptidase-like regulatory domain-containing protein [Planctomycetaceae bacterium]|nr:carboxypeptidase-like regulatory domain-containing protein [Planctomycetaceae bacterium]
MGCHKGRQVPTDLPKLYRCVIHLTQENQPVPDAVISLRSVNSGDKQWAIGGSTNETGKAEIFTETYFKGVPSGEYKVVVSKTEIIIPPTPAVLPENEEERTKILNRIEAETKEYSVVASEFSDVKTTPLKINVQEKETEISFELGAKVTKSIR